MEQKQIYEKIKGVCLDKTKNLWVVRFMFKKQFIYLGSFFTYEQAIMSLDLFYEERGYKINERTGKHVQLLKYK
jgi:hypothetical protein